MDLRVTAPPANAAERAAVDSVLGAPPSTWAGAPRTAGDGRVAFGGDRMARERRRLLLPVLHAVQEQVGWVSPSALGYVALRLDVAPAEVFGVASAYALIALEESAPIVVHVCDDIACRVGGGDPTVWLEGQFPSGGGEAICWKKSPCLGHCEHGSAAVVQQAGERGGRAAVAPFAAEDYQGLVTLGERTELSGLPSPESLVPQAAARADGLRLLRRLGRVDPDSLGSYRAAGGYAALTRALSLGPEAVLEELKRAKLLGRGGAAFPTGVKWEAVAKNPVRPHYFVANADESEPGTFKDRVLMENDPFALVEALTIAGIVTGSERGFVYIRGEYPLGERRLERAVASARAAGLLGVDILGSGHSFDVEVRRGAGAYIAGEETALFNSIEGRRPEPRNKPPFPAQRGLFGKPTGVNNVETLLCVLDILTEGADSFAAVGTPESSGTRLFCLSGAVTRPGLYEVALGTTLRELLELAGGVRGGLALKAVLLGGAAGSFVLAEDLDLPLSFEAVRAAGTTLGSGVVLVLDETADMVDFVRRIAEFFRDESCGQCVPCRVGTQRQEELLSRMASRSPLGSPGEEERLLADLGQVMRDASICGLGQTASAAIESALRRGLISLDGAQA